MKRMITKQMRDSFNLSIACKIDLYKQVKLIDGFRSSARVSKSFRLAHKQRILILRITIK